MECWERVPIATGERLVGQVPFFSSMDAERQSSRTRPFVNGLFKNSQTKPPFGRVTTKLLEQTLPKCPSSMSSGWSTVGLLVISQRHPAGILEFFLSYVNDDT